MRQPGHTRKPDLPCPPVPQAAEVIGARVAADHRRRRRPYRRCTLARKLPARAVGKNAGQNFGTSQLRRLYNNSNYNSWTRRLFDDDHNNNVCASQLVDNVAVQQQQQPAASIRTLLRFGRKTKQDQARTRVRTRPRK